MSLKDWIQKGRELGASDLHLEPGTPLVVRVRGDLTAVGEPIPAQRIMQSARELLGREAWGQFLERGSADVALAALIEEINTSRARNIITLESPLEYLFTNRRSFIRQREIPTHSPTFEQAVIDALRENPDVLVISEMRTREVIRLTLNAAETGHLVLATMHSASCGEALSRICMSFPAEIQGSIRAQLADALVGVVCQRLDFLPAHHLRVPRCEVLLASSAAKGTLRAGQFTQIPNVILSGGEEGMWTFDRYQRWMEQKTDWVRPAPTRSPSEEVTAVVNVPKAPPPQASANAAEVLAKDGASEQPTEISIDEDIDPNELAELARKVEERTR